MSTLQTSIQYCTSQCSNVRKRNDWKIENKILFNIKYKKKTDGVNKSTIIVVYKGIYNYNLHFCGSGAKESACNAGDLGLNPGLGRFSGEGNGYPLQYSCLENSMGRRP